MLKTTHFLNNTRIRPPKNWRELVFELNFDKEMASSTVTITEWDFVIENAATINKWIADGMNGSGPGIFEGIPYRIEVEEAGQMEVIFDGYIDLTQASRFSCERVNAIAKERQKIDWLNDRADGFTFECLYEELGAITPADFLFQPYVISSIPNYTELMLCLLTAYVVTKELGDSIHQLSAIALESANPLEMTALVRAALLIVYIIATLATLVALITQMIQYLIQPVKYHACMTVKRLFEVGAEHLGLTFKSSIFDQAPFNSLCLMPEKLSQNTSESGGMLKFGSTNTSDPMRGYYNGTFGDFVRAMKQVFNAKCDVTDDKELVFERLDYNPTSANFKIPSIENFYHELNVNEFVSNFLLKFSTDISDRNTIQEYDGTSYQVTLRPIIIKDEFLVLTKGQNVRAFPFALAKRKEELTFIESTMKGFLDVMSGLMNVLIEVTNGIISIYNDLAGIINDVIDALDFVGIDIDFRLEPIPRIESVDFGKIINNRVGMMKLHQDNFDVAKLFVMQQGTTHLNNKLDANNGIYTSAKYLWDNYHFIDSFVISNSNPYGNQKYIYKLEKVPFCFEDYLKVKKNNKVTNSSNEDGTAVSIKWNPWDGHAEILYNINKAYTSNLREITYEPDGK